MLLTKGLFLWTFKMNSGARERRVTFQVDLARYFLHTSAKLNQCECMLINFHLHIFFLLSKPNILHLNQHDNSKGSQTPLILEFVTRILESTCSKKQKQPSFLFPFPPCARCNTKPGIWQCLYLMAKGLQLNLAKILPATLQKKHSIDGPHSQCLRTDLNKRFLSRPKTTTA